MRAMTRARANAKRRKTLRARLLKSAKSVLGSLSPGTVLLPCVCVVRALEGYAIIRDQENTLVVERELMRLLDRLGISF